MKGFGVLEVMISSGIIVIILIALTTASRAALNGNIQNQMRAQAIFLAQEGLEAVREARDSGWIGNISGTGWNSLVWNGDELNLVDTTSLGCYRIDFKTTVNRFGLTKTSACPPLNSDLEKITILSQGDEFDRYVQIESVGDRIMKDDTASSVTAGTNLANSIKVTVVVNWGAGKSISESTILTNWKPNF